MLHIQHIASTHFRHYLHFYTLVGDIGYHVLHKQCSLKSNRSEQLETVFIVVVLQHMGRQLQPAKRLLQATDDRTTVHIVNSPDNWCCSFRFFKLSVVIAARLYSPFRPATFGANQTLFHTFV